MPLNPNRDSQRFGAIMKLVFYVIISFVVGIVAGYLLKKTEFKTELVEAKTTQRSVTITKKIKKLADGTETTDQIESYLTNYYENKKAVIQSNQPSIKKYSVGLLGVDSVKAVSVDARLGGLPLFIGGQYNIKEPKSSIISLRFEF